jgi:hypothetical protein
MPVPVTANVGLYWLISFFFSCITVLFGPNWLGWVFCLELYSSALLTLVV